MNDNFRIILDKETIEDRVKEIGKKISEDYAGKQPIIICMLKGAVYFFADLTKHIDLPIMIDFARLSSYKNGITSGDMEVVADITTKIEGKDVIIVEDIVDSGKTLSYFIKMLEKRKLNSVKICAFIDKKEKHEVEISVDYVGFDVKCGFVIGYGMDYAEKYRELPYLAEVIDPSKL